MEREVKDMGLNGREHRLYEPFDTQDMLLWLNLLAADEAVNDAHVQIRNSGTKGKYLAVRVDR